MTKAGRRTCGSPPARPRCARSSSRCAKPRRSPARCWSARPPDRWNVDERECETADGFVINGARTLSFGELAEEAADRSPASRPAASTIGQRAADRPAARSGSTRPPRPTAACASPATSVCPACCSHRRASRRPAVGSPTSRARRSRSVPGVRHIAARDGWFAVVADNWWAAEQARQGRGPEFHRQSLAGRIARAVRRCARNSGRAERSFGRGDYDNDRRAARARSPRPTGSRRRSISGLEPLTATARVSGDQARGLGCRPRRPISRAPLGRMRSLYPMPVGEPAGRALEADAIPIAVDLARTLERAGPGNPAARREPEPRPRLARRACTNDRAPRPGGITAAWQMRVATGDGLGSAIARLTGASEPGKLGRSRARRRCAALCDPRMSAIEGVRVVPPMPATCAARRSANSPSSPKASSTSSRTPRASSRSHSACRCSAATRASRAACRRRRSSPNGTAAGAGAAWGSPAARPIGSHIALVANATIGDDQSIKVHRLVAAVDCGRIVNSGLVTQQIEGGLIWAMAQATVPAPEWVAGMPRARPIGASACRGSATRPTSRPAASRAASRPGGVSGLGTTVLAPAVANAIYAGTGSGCASCRSTDGGMSRRHPSRSRRPADQPRHARRARRAGGAPLSRRVPERPARGRNPGDRVEADPPRHHPAHAPEASSAEAYRQVWTNEGSPLAAIAQRQADALRERIGDRSASTMRCATAIPGIAAAIERMVERGLHAHPRGAALSAILRGDDGDRATTRCSPRSPRMRVAAGAAHAAALL